MIYEHLIFNDFKLLKLLTEWMISLIKNDY